MYGELNVCNRVEEYLKKWMRNMENESKRWNCPKNFWDKWVIVWEGPVEGFWRRKTNEELMKEYGEASITGTTRVSRMRWI